jgi:hypothetical protein
VRTLAALALAAAALLPAAPASAYCTTTPVGGCVNPCYAVANAWARAETATGGALPDRTWYCLD